MGNRRVVLLALTGAIASASALAFSAPAGAATLEAQAVLPPGQSGFVSIPGVLSGSGSPHLYDQVSLFNAIEYRPFNFNQPGDTETPEPGISITRDSYGVPSITAQNGHDAWWGVGYAIAQDRLFELELFRRATSGHLAELQGPAYIDDDLIARRDYYTGAELDRMLAALPDALVHRMAAYRDGINAWIDHVRANPLDTPGEFVALQVPIRDWTVRDSARVGIFLARTVPSSNGAEFNNARALQSMSAADFETMHPLRTPGRLTTVPTSEGTFPSQPGRTRLDERIGFRRSRQFVEGLDLGSATDTAVLASRSAGIQVSATAAGAGLRRIIPSPAAPSCGRSAIARMTAATSSTGRSWASPFPNCSSSSSSTTRVCQASAASPRRGSRSSASGTTGM